ncbi:MAG: hypothetical protein QOD59_1644 [Mycobacterium sp.]|jgi:hypothetical protein|nr:conserved hypothetical rane protein [Mycobacterium sp.]MDT5159929.1 hypothetical protein [Mycobacterium sp.]MDT7792208.1 hypothetical protein [Mycobacterium sp.]
MTAPPSYGQPHEGIAVTTRYFASSWLFAAVKPKILVSGLRDAGLGMGTHRATTDSRAVPRARVRAVLLSAPGPADYTVAVNPGQIVELEYRVPLRTFSRGALGPPPQRYNGVGVTVAIMAAAVLLMIIWMVVVVAMSR